MSTLYLHWSTEDQRERPTARLLCYNICNVRIYLTACDFVECVTNAINFSFARQPAMCPLESHTIVRKIGIIGQGAHSAPYAFICLDRSERTTAGDVRCFLVDPGPDSAGHFCDSKATLWPEINAEHSILIE